MIYANPTGVRLGCRSEIINSNISLCRFTLLWILLVSRRRTTVRLCDAVINPKKASQTKPSFAPSFPVHFIPQNNITPSSMLVPLKELQEEYQQRRASNIYLHTSTFCIDILASIYRRSSPRSNLIFIDYWPKQRYHVIFRHWL